MLTTFFSVKGGSGTSAIAAAAAVMLSRTEHVRLIDMAGGDLFPLLRQPVNEDRHAVLSDRMQLTEIAPSDSLERWAAATDNFAHRTVVDLGTITDPLDSRWGLVRKSGEAFLVMRPCFLALTRAARVLPDIGHLAVIILREPDRAIDAAVIEDVLGRNVAAELTASVSVARAIDAGLFGCDAGNRLAAQLEATLALRIDHTAS